MRFRVKPHHAFHVNPLFLRMSQADRLDYSLVSKIITERIRGADILNDVEGSDHWPITLELS